MGAADVLSRLHDVRDPATGAVDAITEALAGGSLGLLSALLLFALFRSLTSRLPTRWEVVGAELAKARRLAPEQRLLALAKLIERISPEGAVPSGSGGPPDGLRSPQDRDAAWQRLRADLREALYRPGAAIDPGRVEEEILHLLSLRKR